VLGVLRHRDFGLLWTGQAVSLIGDGIYLVAIAWLVYDLSNSPAALGLVGLAWTLPQVMALLGSGVLSDRFERRRLLIAADLLRVAAIGGIAALTIADAVELWHVTVLVVFYGLGEALFLPAFSAIVPDVVPKEELLQAATLKELVEPIGLRFAGPAVGGALNATAGVGAAFAVDAVSFAVSAAVVSLMSRQPPPDKEPSPLRRELGQGFAYVRAHAWLWATLASAAVALLASFGPTEVLLPFIIRNDLDGGAGTFGLVLSAGGVGSVMAALVMSWTGAPRRHVTFMYLT